MASALIDPFSPNPWRRRLIDTCRNDLKTVADYTGGKGVWRHNTEEGDPTARPIRSFLGRNGHAAGSGLTKGSTVAA